MVDLFQDGRQSIHGDLHRPLHNFRRVGGLDLVVMLLYPAHFFFCVHLWVLNF